MYLIDNLFDLFSVILNSQILKKFIKNENKILLYSYLGKTTFRHKFQNRSEFI